MKRLMKFLDALFELLWLVGGLIYAVIFAVHVHPGMDNVTKFVLLVILLNSYKSYDKPWHDE